MKHFLIMMLLHVSILAIGCDAPRQHRATLGSHKLTILDASGDEPIGGKAGIHTKKDGSQTYSYKTDNGRYNVSLIGDELTINDDQYTLDQQGSEIRIVADRVEINGVTVSPDAE